MAAAKKSKPQDDTAVAEKVPAKKSAAKKASDQAAPVAKKAAKKSAAAPAKAGGSKDQAVNPVTAWPFPLGPRPQ